MAVVPSTAGRERRRAPSGLWKQRELFVTHVVVVDDVGIHVSIAAMLRILTASATATATATATAAPTALPLPPPPLPMPPQSHYHVIK